VNPFGFTGCTLAGAGPALVGLARRAEDRVREVASFLVRRSRPAFSEAFRSSFAHRGSGTVAPGLASLRSRLVSAAFPRPHVSFSRLAPPSGRPEDRRRCVLAHTTALPSWALVLYSASSAADPVKDSPASLPSQNHPSRGAQPRHLPPSAFRWCTLTRAPSSPSAVCSPPRLPCRLAATRNAPEVPSSGLLLHGARVPLSRPLLSCRCSHRRRR
jgi:hypothetical protein